MAKDTVRYIHKLFVDGKLMMSVNKSTTTKPAEMRKIIDKHLHGIHYEMEEVRG